MPWINIESYNVCIDKSYTEFKTKKEVSVAIFDLTDTLIFSKNGSLLRYDIDPKNYHLIGTGILKKLNEKYIIIIMCKNEYYDRCINVQKEMSKILKFSPIFIRTPNSGLGTILRGFDVIKSILNIEFNTENSFLCGDGIGKKDIYPPYRFSDIDTKLAKSLNLMIIRPIDILGAKSLEPKNYQEIILTMGNPGSGKSTSAQILIDSPGSKYIACDTDEMPGYDRRLTLECTRNNLLRGKSVIVLANNASKKERNDYISIARDLNIPIRLAWFIRDGRPFNFFRGKEQSSLPSTHYHKKPVPLKVYETYTQRFEEPSLEEVDEINLIF